MMLKRNDDTPTEAEVETEWAASSETPSFFDPFAEGEFPLTANNEEGVMKALTHSCEESSIFDPGFI
jgi:hypothetical protein